ncbi:MAG: insulinase family protein [Candidatus Latescibacteria bacterium]|nr:insulinase family protein [Candidatus Latescibacterota bacterium]
MIRRPLLLVLFLLIPSESFGQRVQVPLTVTRHRLENGLQILAREDHSLPVISFYTFFRVGSRNETVGLTGISHLFEHLMFNGAKKYGSKEFDRVLEANGGFSNAYTITDMTSYYQNFPSDKLELIIDLDSDRMASLALTEESLRSEREVVKEERGLRIDNEVSGAMMEQLYALAYLAHPYRWQTVGWMSDLDNITLQDCRQFFRTYYAPNNAVIVLSGDFKTEEAVALIRTYYGGIPSQPPPRPVGTIEPEQRGERRAVFQKPAELPALAVGYHGPSVRSEDIFVLEVLEVLLARGESSRLYRRLVYEEQAAVSVSAAFPWMLDPGLLTFSVEVKPDQKTEEVEGLLYAEIERLKQEPVPDRELRKAKNILQAEFVKGLETNNGTADNIGMYELLFGDWSMMRTALDRYEAVTAEDVARVARAYLSDSSRTVVTLIPEVE